MQPVTLEFAHSAGWKYVCIGKNFRKYMKRLANRRYRRYRKRIEHDALYGSDRAEFKRLPRPVTDWDVW